MTAIGQTTQAAQTSFFDTPVSWMQEHPYITSAALAALTTVGTIFALAAAAPAIAAGILITGMLT